MDFATGAFSVDGMTSQRFHFNDMFDDDVISSFTEFEWEYKEFFCNGYNRKIDRLCKKPTTLAIWFDDKIYYNALDVYDRLYEIIDGLIQ